jgi:iron complex outermembrane recepter protein
MKVFFTFYFSIFTFILFSQNYLIKGSLKDEAGQPISYATTALKLAKDSSLVKVEMTDENGNYSFLSTAEGVYFIQHSFVGFQDYTSDPLTIKSDLTIPTCVMKSSVENMEEVVVSAKRALIEVKPDRNIFNVQGTINTTGENGLSLLRKAPGVRLDNNNNISVLGRAGVLVYIDGKRLPLSGDELTNYLQTLTSEQIDRIEIITNPGAKYEAQGNAGIIDIKLKKDKNLGANGSASMGISKGRYQQFNTGASGNYRNKKLNAFGNVNYSLGTFWNRMNFENFQNGFLLDEKNLSTNENQNTSLRLGTDFYLSKKSTIGFLVTRQMNSSIGESTNDTKISSISNRTKIDSILIAPNNSDSNGDQASYNINYAYESGNFKMNMDADYASFENESDYRQPNYYYNDDKSKVLRLIDNKYSTPSKIEISTAKVDFETKLGIGKIEFGSKISKVKTDNVFNFYNVIENVDVFNTRRSNKFLYDENVTAGYVSYAAQLNSTWNVTGGLRVEHTAAEGDLSAFSADLEEEPVVFDYVKYFPTAGISYAKNPEHAYSLKYGRRINRPDYAVLNPFREQLSELSFSKGNKNLKPEIVNNLELSYTLKYMYNFSLSYSLTNDQITRLIGPDDIDTRAGFISWDNLSTQRLYALNASVPATINKWWSSYFNFGFSFTDNKANYGKDGIVDVQAYNYTIFQQQTFSLPNKIKAEVSGWYSGPGVWGGVFLFDPSYSLDFGIQRRFFKEKLNIKLSAADVFFQSGWSGASNFNGLYGKGNGNWDSRRISLNFSYDLGNSNVKSRKRKTSAEDELGRIKK